MTHYYQYDSSLPHSRRRLNAAFVHRLKKLVGRVYHLHVVEIFADEDHGDYVSVRNKNRRVDARNAILALCKAYGIGDEFIHVYDEELDDKDEFIDIHLTKPAFGE